MNSIFLWRASARRLIASSLSGHMANWVEGIDESYLPVQSGWFDGHTLLLMGDTWDLETTEPWNTCQYILTALLSLILHRWKQWPAIELHFMQALMVHKVVVVVVHRTSFQKLPLCPYLTQHWIFWYGPDKLVTMSISPVLSLHHVNR